MKVFAVLATALLTATVSARASFFGSSDVTPFDDDVTKVPGDNPLVHCADPKDDILILKSVDLDPNPPQAGKTLTVTAKGNLTEDVEEGAKVHLQVKFGLITIINQNADLCDTVKNVNLTCPVKKGETELTKEVELPKIIPPGKYSVIADVFTKDEEKITCLQATVEFKKGGGNPGLFKQGL